MQKKTIVAKTPNAIEEYEKFVSILMHDLRAPIANMIEFAELVGSEESSEIEKFQYSQIIAKEGNKTLRMIQSYLTLQKIESGKMTLVKKSKAINELMIELESTFSSFKSLGSELFIQSFVERNEVEIEEDLFSLALTNLLKNAAEAAHGTRVHVYLYEEVDNFCVMIENFGEVPEVIREHLFEKFATAGKKNGTGLGLFGARLIARAHGGDLYYESLPGGTQFTLKIPFN